jgi:adenosine deaminase
MDDFTPNDNSKSYFHLLPKVEIHNHLEGTITPATLQKLAKKHLSESILASDIQECKKVYQFTDFSGFLNSFSLVNSFIKESSDIDIIFKNNIASLQQENYKYVEYFLSIDTFINKGIPLTELLDRIKTNIKQNSSKKFLIGGIIIDFVRNYGPDSAMKIMEELSPIIDDYRDCLLGISIGGDEFNFPAPPFANIFQKAKHLNLKTTAHAGEAAGAQSIWDTIFSLKTDRIGHGLHISDSPDLVKHFRVTQTPIEVCPTSNFKTNTINKLESHPLPKYVTQGLNVTINTDDSGFFQNDLSSELELCHKLLHLDLEEIKQCVLNAAHNCFVDQFTKMELLEDIKLNFDNE